MGSELDVRWLRLSCSIRKPKEGRGPREEDRVPALGVEGPHPVAGVMGTGRLLLCALMTPIDSPHPAI
jgi:hypothetical protein